MKGTFISKRTAEEIAELYRKIGFDGLSADEIKVSVTNEPDGKYGIEVSKKDIWDLI